jgi:hypothetical protein
VSHDDQDINHAHTWGSKRYRDFCHWVRVEQECKTCPAVLVGGTEARDFDLNPLQVTFADPDCQECRRLLEGREPASWAALSSGGTHG